MKLYILMQVLLASFLGLTAGLLTSPDSNWFGIPLIELYGLMRDLVLNALMLIIVPLFASYIIITVSKANGQLEIKTFSVFTLMILLVVLVTFLQPGGITWPEDLKNLSKYSKSSGFAIFSIPFFLLIPSNIIEAASQNNILGVIVFALFFGFSMTKINEQAAITLHSMFSGIFQVMMRITHLIIRALPIGVFGMIAHVTATIG